MKLRDVDSAEVSFRMRAAGYAALIGTVAAGVGFIFFAGSDAPILFALLAGLVLAAIVYFGSLTVAEQTGRAGASIFQPSGSSTPAIREYSYADSLVARGQLVEAVEAYRQLGIEHPADPEPRLRQARVLRDHLRAYDEAVSVFRQILMIPTLAPEKELAVLRELVELCVHKQDQPQRALPYLARIAEKFSGTPTAAWARTEAREIKHIMQQDHD